MDDSADDSVRSRAGAVSPSRPPTPRLCAIQPDVRRKLAFEGHRLWILQEARAGQYQHQCLHSSRSIDHFAPRKLKTVTFSYTLYHLKKNPCIHTLSQSEYAINTSFYFETVVTDLLLFQCSCSSWCIGRISWPDLPVGADVYILTWCYDGHLSGTLPIVKSSDDVNMNIR